MIGGDRVEDPAHQPLFVGGRFGAREPGRPQLRRDPNHLGADGAVVALRLVRGSARASARPSASCGAFSRRTAWHPAGPRPRSPAAPPRGGGARSAPSLPAHARWRPAAVAARRRRQDRRLPPPRPSSAPRRRARSHPAAVRGPSRCGSVPPAGPRPARSPRLQHRPRPRTRRAVPRPRRAAPPAVRIPARRVRTGRRPGGRPIRAGSRLPRADPGPRSASHRAAGRADRDRWRRRLAGP